MECPFGLCEGVGFPGLAIRSGYRGPVLLPIQDLHRVHEGIGIWEHMGDELVQIGSRNEEGVYLKDKDVEFECEVCWLALAYARRADFPQEHVEGDEGQVPAEERAGAAH